MCEWLCVCVCVHLGRSCNSASAFFFALTFCPPQVKAHPHFRLFATQNPPGAYGGRKVLSRAFRNRFLELHVADIPESELVKILEKRCSLPASHCQLLVNVMRKLQERRQSSHLFAGKHGFITPRDLLRWANRSPSSKQEIAREGFMLLAERLRREEDREAVREVLRKEVDPHLDVAAIYSEHAAEGAAESAAEGAADRATATGDAAGAPAKRKRDDAAELESAKKRSRDDGGAARDVAAQQRPGGTVAGAADGVAAGSGQVDWSIATHYRRLRQALETAPSAPSAPEGAELRQQAAEVARSVGKVTWTKSLRRLFALVGRCLQHQEPVLLVGETGCGKTTVCQLYSVLLNRKLHILNCHQHTETADVLGGLRPVRGKSTASARFHAALAAYFAALAASPFAPVLQTVALPAGIAPEVAAGDLPSVSRAPVRSLSAYFVGVHAAVERQQQQQQQAEMPPTTDAAVDGPGVAAVAAQLSALAADAQEAHRCVVALFEWVDGPLVQAMRHGDMVLLDEISLAEDAVLERLNSVLEPGRTLTLAEKGGEAVEVLVAHPDFRVLATMNPGGDFGKRELSPALRNRFTEIWVPSITDEEDLLRIVTEKLGAEHLRPMAPHMLRFLAWLGGVLPASSSAGASAGTVGAQVAPSGGDSVAGSSTGSGRGVTMSLRDVLSWVEFMNAAAVGSDALSAWQAFLHGAAMVLLDGVGLGTGMSLAASQRLQQDAMNFLLALAPDLLRAELRSSLAPGAPGPGCSLVSPPGADGVARFGIPPFRIQLGAGALPSDLGYAMRAPTTSRNLFKVLRALQVRKPVLLEGSPGVGKTSLIAALAAASGHTLVRINLSEQTDMADLLGSDLPMPVEDVQAAPGGGAASSGGQFAWSDGVLLEAIKQGHWVLLDELNLAPQSVLEGLNSVLDHRATVYIPELDRTFYCPPTFRVFACQVRPAACVAERLCV